MDVNKCSIDDPSAMFVVFSRILKGMTFHLGRNL